MDKIRVLVVDDSPFSQRVIQNALSVPGIEVCGIAESGREGLELYRIMQPDVVTMDVTMPDMDGLTCSREIKAAWPDAKIIMLSAMKDDLLVSQGQTIGIKAFLQKPVKSSELVDTIKQVCGRSLNQCDFYNQYLAHFAAAFEMNVSDINESKCEISTSPITGGIFASEGLAIVIGITGQIQGRVILDMSRKTAQMLAERVCGGQDVREVDMLHSVSEFANIIAGHGVSRVNNIFQSFDLRLTPPSILFGDTLNIMNPQLHSFIVTAETAIGRIALSVGFVGGK